jgi:hypothetical protein
MKKIFGLLIAILLLTGCDDGNMTFQTFNFTSNPVKCELTTNTYLSINPTTKEVLILTFPSTALLNRETNDADGNPIPQAITLSNIEYRVYSGATPALGNICTSVDNGTVNVTQRWTGSGSVTITTTKVPLTTESTDIRYVHSVTLNDVSFKKGDETIRVLDNFLGEINTSLGFMFDFTESATSISTLNACNDGRLYLTLGNKALLINLPAGTFTNETRTQTYTTDDTHQARMRVYDGTGINSTVVCNGALTPALKQEWSTTTNSGSIIVESTESVDTPGRYIHKVYLQNNTRFYNITSNGEFFTPENNDAGRYYIGTYSPQN